MQTFSKQKFLQLTKKRQHKHAAILLRKCYLDPTSLPEYEKIQTWMNLSKIDNTQEAISDRYHEHLAGSGTQLPENQLLPTTRHTDSLEGAPYLPYDIYLDGLRSTHNIGSIIRTTEALRIGDIHFSPKTPYIDHTKVQKTAMNTETLVTCYQSSPLETLKRPLIAFETTTNATPLYDFTFPDTGTLMLGNEEYGLSEQALTAADHIVQIPLYGTKNSLNVACAYAIIASHLRANQ